MPSRPSRALRLLIEKTALKVYAWIGPRLFSGRYFDRRYRGNNDPWNYEHSPYEGLKYRQTIEILDRPLYRRVLEVGCSIGVFTEQLAKSGLAEKVVGIDVSRLALENAGKRLERFKHVELREANILYDPLDGPFDLVFCAELLYYLGSRNIPHAVDKLIATLAEEGELVLVNPLSLPKSLHEPFFKRPELRLLKRHEEKEPDRPYSIELFVKTRSCRGPH